MLGHEYLLSENRLTEISITGVRNTASKIRVSDLRIRVPCRQLLTTTTKNRKPNQTVGLYMIYGADNY